ncbi:MAG: coproporphyrinogen-III oxidase family protein [bacterium]
MNPEKFHGLYIHVPFCTSRCSYCDFYSKANVEESVIKAYQKRTLSLLPNALLSSESRKLGSVYMGGGTPSLMNSSWFNKIAEILVKNSVNLKDIEWTVEINPEDISCTFLQNLKNSGVNRISTGIQSFDEKILNIMGRRSSVETLRKKLPLVGKYFDSFSCDIIYGIKGRRNIEKELEELMNIASPQHISAYCYTPPEKEKAPEPADENQSLQEEKILREILFEKGFEQYEISNYSIKKHRSVHNMNYWLFGSYSGIGPSAHSFFPEKKLRLAFIDNIHNFIKGEPPVEKHLSNCEMIKEFLMMGLRTVEGIDLNRFPKKFSMEPELFFNEIPGKFLKYNSGRVAFTKTALNYYNDLLAKLFCIVEKNC